METQQVLGLIMCVAALMATLIVVASLCYYIIKKAMKNELDINTVLFILWIGVGVVASIFYGIIEMAKQFKLL